MCLQTLVQHPEKGSVMPQNEHMVELRVPLSGSDVSVHTREGKKYFLRHFLGTL